MSKNKLSNKDFFGLNNKVFIIAEIGKNFIQTEKDQPVSVYLVNAKKLVDEAKKAGADAVKFQTHNVEDEQLNIKITSPHFNGADRYSWLTRNTLATPLNTFWRPLKKYCDKIGIIFFSTPMSRGAAMILEKLGVKLWKIGSGDILDFPMLDFMAKTGKPIILSSGMSTSSEITKSVNFLKKRNPNIALVHAVSRYPCPPEKMNIRTMIFLKNKFKLPVGFSHNSPWPELSLAAVALGARIIEQHFTLNRNHWGADHKVSMEPDEFKKMVKEIRAVEHDKLRLSEYLKKPSIKKVLGNLTKNLQKDEAIFRPIFRKALVAATDLKAGTTITSDLIYALRPKKYIKGLPSEHYENILGKKTRRAIKKFEPITERSII